MLNNCVLCPRKCKVNRLAEETGFCGMTGKIKAARAALHMWEEPCISGKNGSGTVFFSGCNLKCIYCQNHEISFSGKGIELSAEKLRDVFLRLVDNGAENINLVTPTHYVPLIVKALEKGLPIPLVYNCGGYESAETLKMLDGLVDIYLPDFKYSQADIAFKYSKAADYPEVARLAVIEMYRQTGKQVFSDDGMLKKGVQVRHLVLPNNLENTYGVIDIISDLFPFGEAGFSLMSQFTPTEGCKKYPELCRRLESDEYEKAVNYMYLCGIENGFVQELSSAKEEYIPPFDYEGL